MALKQTIGFERLEGEKTRVGGPVGWSSAQGRHRPGTSDDGAVVGAINVTQVAGLVFSLLSNLSSTTFVALKTWRHRVAMRKFLRAAQSLGNRAETILALLVESGFIYCIIGIVVIVSTLTPLPHGTLGDLFLPSAAQITGIYPTMVLIVVSMRATMDETAFDAAESTLNVAPPSHFTRSMTRSQLARLPPDWQEALPTRKLDVDKPLPQLHSTKEGHI
ncbi:hypothetical protein AURDEDRAFT_156594 [Auricularia subglabra TFB-10046 SS5]|nr:hypothetical protein AURDEDRAFT_156594 [Auricularia subglabra TFB-10046 SS5]